MPRRAALCLLTCVLGLVTAVTLLIASATVGDARPNTPSAAMTETTVRAFYDAVNAAIHTGDVSALDAVVAPEFVDHAPAPGMPPDRAGLARYLSGIHAAYPDTELVMEEMVAVGDRALAWVSVRGAEDGSFLGLPLAGAPAVWEPLAVVRVTERRIVEHWGGADGLIAFEPLGEAPLGTRLPTNQGVAFERLTWPPGWRDAARDQDEARLLYVEKGMLTVTIAPDSPRPALLVTFPTGNPEHRSSAVSPGTDSTLVAGDLLMLPPQTNHTIHNDAALPAETLVAAVFAPGSPSHSADRADPAYQRTAPVPPNGIAVQPLVGEKLATLPPGEATMALGRVTLASGAEMTIDEAAGPVLLSIEAGTLDLETGSTSAWGRRGANGASSAQTTSSLSAGDGALLQPWTTATLQNAGDKPLVLLALTILPDAAQA